MATLSTRDSHREALQGWARRTLSQSLFLGVTALSFFLSIRLGTSVWWFLLEVFFVAFLSGGAAIGVWRLVALLRSKRAAPSDQEE